MKKKIDTQFSRDLHKGHQTDKPLSVFYGELFAITDVHSHGKIPMLP